MGREKKVTIFRYKLNEGIIEHFSLICNTFINDMQVRQSGVRRQNYIKAGIFAATQLSYRLMLSYLLIYLLHGAESFFRS